MRLKKKDLKKLIKEANALLSEEYSTGVEDTDEDLSAWGGKCYINAGPDSDVNEKISLPFRALGIPKVICDLISIKVYNQDPAIPPPPDDDEITGKAIFAGDYFDKLETEHMRYMLAKVLKVSDAGANHIAIAKRIDDVFNDLTAIAADTSETKLKGLKKAQEIFPAKIKNESSGGIALTDDKITKRINDDNIKTAPQINKEVKEVYRAAIIRLVKDGPADAGLPEDDPTGRKALRAALASLTNWKDDL